MDSSLISLRENSELEELREGDWRSTFWKLPCFKFNSNAVGFTAKTNRFMHLTTLSLIYWQSV